MLYQIQDAPTEKLDTTTLDDQEAQYWARRMDAAMSDLEQGNTRLRVAGKMKYFMEHNRWHAFRY
jgi:hypothetical protein